MPRSIRLLILVVAVALLWRPVWADPPKVSQTELAKKLVDQMAAGDFEKAVEPFDPTMQGALPATKLKQVWQSLVGRYGPLKEATVTRSEAIGQLQAVYVGCQFERDKLAAKVVFTADDQITGLFFQPAAEYKAPAYVDPAAFTESQIDVGQGPLALPGTLSLPKGDGPFPAVVLVHGSGPNDRDETVGPSKPFRDLAQGLASRGIAVLRYEKRTKAHPAALAQLPRGITVKEETVDDAAAAVGLLASHEKIDPKRIFVLGHSLGGSLLPRIAAARGDVAGLISLAGSTRRLEDVILDQFRYLFALDGTVSLEELAQLEVLERQVALVKSTTLAADTPAEDLPLKIPAGYWLDLRDYSPAEAAKATQQPMLILQGERDYQVTMDDLRLWRQALDSRPDVTFITYPALNHLFMAGEGKSTAAEYWIPGSVAPEVVRDIARWINQHPSR